MHKDLAEDWMERVVILGAKGQLGIDLCQEYEASGEEFVPLSHADVDVCDYGQVAAILASLWPSAVINSAALTNVEACEENVEETFAVNCYAVRNLARVCGELELLLVHLSSDYVFGGDQMTRYAEDSAFNPLNVYGVSKAPGEYFVRNLCQKHLVIRTSGLYGLAGSSGKGGNFVETMLRLGQERGEVSVVTDQVLTPTYTYDLASKIRELVGRGAQGVFHVTNSSACSWYEFARGIFDLWDPRVEVKPTTSADFGSTVRRPTYSVLDNRRLREEGLSILRPWPLALAAYLEARKIPSAPGTARKS